MLIHIDHHHINMGVVMNGKLGMAGMAVGIVVVMGSGVAVASSGTKLTLGDKSKTGSLTTLVGTKGTPLKLDALNGDPVLKVGNSTKIPNLNADLLDGQSASSFQRTITGSCAKVPGNFITGVAGAGVSCGDQQGVTRAMNPSNPPSATAAIAGDYLVFANVSISDLKVPDGDKAAGKCEATWANIVGSLPTPEQADVTQVQIPSGGAIEVALGTSAAQHIDKDATVTVQCFADSTGNDSVAIGSGAITLLPVVSG